MIGAKSMVVPYLPPKTLVGRNQKLNNYPIPEVTGRKDSLMKLAARELYVDGKYSILDGFDWKTNEAIYRQAIETAEGIKPVYVRVPFEE